MTHATFVNDTVRLAIFTALDNNNGRAYPSIQPNQVRDFNQLQARTGTDMRLFAQVKRNGGTYDHVIPVTATNFSEVFPYLTKQPQHSVVFIAVSPEVLANIE